MNGDQEEIFWSRVKITYDCTCWEWQAGRNKPGWYGHFRVDGKKKLCHRLAWERVNCEIPSHLRILHKCDNPICVRPDHLQIGTQTDNIHDMEKKGRGRHPFGTASGLAKLNDADVAAIRARWDNGESGPSIWKDYPNMKKSALYYAAVRKTWKHLA